MQPIVMSGDPRGRPGQLTVSDPRLPLALFRYQVIPQADFDAAQSRGIEPQRPHAGIMIWIEPAR
jgi:hypothetical protein